MKKRAVLMALLLLSGCGVFKRTYIVPTHSFPAQYANQSSVLNTINNDMLKEWWLQFNDPVLTALINKALEQNYDIRLAVEKIEEARAFYQIKQSALFPQISLIGDAQRSGFSALLPQLSALQQPVSQNNFIGPPGTNNSFFNLGFDASWEIDFWGKIWHEKDARLYAFQARIEQMWGIYLILLAEVAHTYISLCSLQAQVQLLREKIMIDEQLILLQKDVQIAGLSSKIDVIERRKELLDMRNQAELLLLAAAQTKNKLAILVGDNPESLIVATSAVVPISHAELCVGVPSDILKRRPDIREAERTLASAHSSVARAIAEWFPSFSLIGGAATQASKGYNMFRSGSLTWVIGPSVRWPLINFGVIQAQIKTEKSIERQAALTYSKLIINALKEVEDSLIAYFKRKEQCLLLLSKKQQVIRAEDLIKDKYVAGLTDQFELYDFMCKRISAEQELVAVQEEFSKSLVSLYKALGGGW